jgi:hypothetical protein|tara:strand:- start:563 stop:1120 length:558 start_codon:yes stop_codon:yes gene_type:complete
MRIRLSRQVHRFFLGLYIKMSLATSVYESAADAGAFIAFCYLVFASIIFIAMIGASLYLIFTKGKHSMETEGTVIDSECKSTNKDNTSRVCNVEMKYNVDEEEYFYRGGTSDTKEKKGASLTMVYDPDDPQNTRIKSGIRRKSAYIMIIIAILVLFVAWLNYYTATKYRAVAAANTVGMVADYAF